MPNILKFLIGLTIAGLVISALFIFGLFILASLAILVPISYIYMRMKHPHIFHTMKTRKTFTSAHDDGQRYGADGQNSPRQSNSNVIEGQFERVDEEANSHKKRG